MWWILNEPAQSLIYQVFRIQREKPVRGDWSTLVQKDLEDLDINLDYDELKELSKYEIKNLLKEQVEKKAFTYLIKLKESQSKLKDLEYNKLETQNYLKPAAGLTKTEVSEIMMCRSRMVPVKANFKSSHNAADLKCRACGDTEELQQHLISCRILRIKHLGDSKSISI